jgi:hypothetical protein
MPFSTVNHTTGEEYMRLVNNEHRIHTTIAPNKNLCIHTSLPKLLHGTSQHEINDDDLKYIIPNLYNGLEKIGIITDFENALITRLDLCRNVAVSQAPSVYMAQISKMTLAYMPHKCIHAKGIRTETMTFQNSQREFTTYDKIEESKANQEQIILKDNTIRFEYRMMTGKIAKKQATRPLKQFINEFESNHTTQFIIGILEKLKGTDRMINIKQPTNLLNTCLMIIAQSGQLDKLIQNEYARIVSIPNRTQRYNEARKLRTKVASLQLSQVDTLEYLKERLAA